jgi:hypothetical protein
MRRSSTAARPRKAGGFGKIFVDGEKRSGLTSRKTDRRRNAFAALKRGAGKLRSKPGIYRKISGVRRRRREVRRPTLAPRWQS